MWLHAILDRSTRRSAKFFIHDVFVKQTNNLDKKKKQKNIMIGGLVLGRYVNMLL